MTDDGAGFATTRLDAVGGHFGLRGIRERVDKMGGALTLDNRPEGGAVVAVSVPTNGAHHAHGSGRAAGATNAAGTTSAAGASVIASQPEVHHGQ